MLKQRRKELGLTLKEMAERMNVTAPQIHHYEDYTRFPNAKEIITLRNAYQMSDEELIKYLEEINKLEKDK